MTTEWQHIVGLIVTDQAIGDALARMAAKFPNDPGAEEGTFSKGTPLLLASDPAPAEAEEAVPKAWAAVVPATTAFVEVIHALLEDAPSSDPRISYLFDRGLTESLWETAKSIVKGKVHRLWQEDGTYTPQPSFLLDFIAESGYRAILS